MAEHDELGHATTAHRAQGATVNTADAIAAHDITQSSVSPLPEARESNQVRRVSRYGRSCR